MAKIKRLSDNVNVTSFAKTYQNQEKTVYNELTESDSLDVNVNASYKIGLGIYDDNNFPNLEDFNGFNFTINELTSYLYQVGLSNWTVSQEYFLNSIVIHNNTIYVSQEDNNIANNPEIISNDYNLSASESIGADAGTFLISLGNNFYVYDKDDGDTLVLVEFDTATKTYNEISSQDISADGYNPENTNNSGMSQGCRLSDNFFAIVGFSTSGSSRSILCYNIDTGTGLFSLKDTINFSGGSGAGQPLQLSEMANLDGSTLLKFTMSSAFGAVPPRLLELNTISETVSDIGLITFSGDSGGESKYIGSAVLNYNDNKIVCAFSDNGPTAPNNGGIGIYQLTGTTLTNIAGSWDNSLYGSFSSVSVKRFSDTKIMTIVRSDTIQTVKTSNLDINGLTFTEESNTDIGLRVSNLVTALVPVDEDKSFMISNFDQSELQTYTNENSEGSWEALGSEDLGFDNSGTSLTSKNAQDAIKEILVDMKYPVGSFYKSVEITEPDIKLGFGTWLKIEGRILIGVNQSDSKFDTADIEGGNRTLSIDGHAVTEGELPYHTHTAPASGGSASSSGPNTRFDSNTTGTVTTDSVGGDEEHTHSIVGNNDTTTLPPFYVIHMWKRTA